MLIINHTWIWICLNNGGNIMKTEMFIECNEKKTDHKILVEKAKDIWKNQGNKVKDLILMELFFKPYENKCYYVFNQDIKGYFEV